MKFIKFSQLIDFKKKSHIKAGDGLSDGSFPFFTSSLMLSKYTEFFQFNLPSLIFGTGGNASIHMCLKPFSVSTDCLVGQLKACVIHKFEIKFIYYYLYGNIRLLEKGFKGAGLRHISKSYINNIDIPHLPIEDQKRIVKILDEADALRQKRKQAIELLDDYLKSVFLEMFGDPVNNPKGWKTFQLKCLIQRIAAGWSANGEFRQKSQDEYGVLKISSVTYGCFNPHEYKAVRIIETNNKNLVHPKKGAILFSRANTRELVGASCIVKEDYPDLFLPDKLWEITVDTSKINPIFFQKNISHISWRNELAKKATGTSGSMLNISMEKFRNEQVIVPPTEMQIKFSKMAQESDSLKQKMLAQSAELETQFQALMQKAFQGEL